MAAIVISLLSMTHVSYRSAVREFQITIRIKTLNVLLLLAAGLVFGATVPGPGELSGQINTRVRDQ